MLAAFCWVCLHSMGQAWPSLPFPRTANASAALRAVFHDAQVPNLHWADGDEIWTQEEQKEAGPYWEMTVMGTHPNALGMFHFTTFWTPRLAALLADTTQLV